MWTLIIFCILLSISNLTLANIDDNLKNLPSKTEQYQQCKFIGDICQNDGDCCSDLICYTIRKNNICLPSIFNQRSKHNLDEFFIPPYYDPNKQLYPYEISKPALPFYKPEPSKQSPDGKKLEWDHCQFHEDCGEGNCCYVHFRFRSLPKWFCRPNRNENNELCEPLAKYHSLKDVPAWKQQQQQKQETENHVADEQQR